MESVTLYVLVWDFSFLLFINNKDNGIHINEAFLCTVCAFVLVEVYQIRQYLGFVLFFQVSEMN